MSRKSKGIAAEREIFHKFWQAGWAAIRVAGSGSTSMPSADILCGNAIRRLAIECKTVKDDRKYIPQEDMKSFIDFARKFGAEPWIAIKFSHRGWFFINPEDMKVTNASHGIDFASAQNKGLSFEELIGDSKKLGQEKEPSRS